MTSNIKNVHLIQDYPITILIGFTTLSFLSYANLEDFVDGYFGGMTPLKNQSFEINSKVVTVTVSNRKTSHLDEPIKLTFYHLTPGKVKD